MKIEKDIIEIVLGVRNGFILGSLIILVVINDDFIYWRKIMGVVLISDEERENMKCIIIKFRLGYVDFIGGMKYNYCDLRNVFECLFVREIVVRVVVGVVLKIFLE